MKGPGREKNEIVAGIRITHADRILYETERVSKGGLARYWEAVADAALPYFVERPLMVLRCPEGAGDSCFFQKHWGRGMPDGLPRVAVRESAGTKPYMYVDALPALITLVQFSVIEVHAWNARRDRLDRPDQLMFDLDPDEQLPWTGVVGAAIAIRDRLGELGLESFVRTTGGKGLHVVAPLVRRAGWDEVRGLAYALTRELVAAYPSRYTASASKKDRVGKIYIDYLRNAVNATAIASFSPRARSGAPVAVPLTWDELAPMRKRPTFNLKNVPRRVGALERDPWAGFSSLRQSITSAMLKSVGVT